MSVGEADPRAVERELQRIQREHAVTLEVVPVGIMMLAGRTIVWVNRAMLELFQYTRAEMVGHTTRMLYASQEDYERYGAQRSAVLGHAETFETESATVRKDGAPLWICVRGRLVDRKSVV